MQKCIWCGREYPDYEKMDVEILPEDESTEIGPVCQKCINLFDKCPYCGYESTCSQCKETARLWKENDSNYKKTYSDAVKLKG